SVGDGEAVAPDAIDELSAGEHAPWGAEKARKEVEFDACELDLVAEHEGPPRRLLHDQRKRSFRRRRGRRLRRGGRRSLSGLSAAQNRAHAGDDLSRRKGLRL